MYHLAYPAELAAGHAWPTTVIGKTYRGKKGQNAYDGMLALWRSPLARGDIVALAEPLAYIPEQKLLVQGTIPVEQSLEDLLKSALDTRTPEALDQLNHYMRMAARGLAALHQSGVRHGETAAWEEWLPDVHDLIDRLVVPAPELANAVTPLLAELESLAATYPADPTVPTHGTFHPEQVLIDRGQIGFIDFDDFCVAEPAMDVAERRAWLGSIRRPLSARSFCRSMSRSRRLRGSASRYGRRWSFSEMLCIPGQRSSRLGRTTAC
jgi:hypothetical protein